jgi:hypothetical protein
MQTPPTLIDIDPAVAGPRLVSGAVRGSVGGGGGVDFGG